MGVLTTGYLMVNSWTDWRRKEVDIVWTVAVFVLTAFIYVGTDQKLCWSGLLQGICLWLASLWRSDQIGSGDGIVLMGIGWIQGIQQACEEKRNFLLYRFYWPDIWCSISENGKQMKRFVNIQKRS